jgi:uncharacterized membrane protein
VQVTDAWRPRRYLAGSIPALVDTHYGHLLLMKVALFLGMVGTAAINRFRLKPRLVQHASTTAAQETVRQLRRNILIEVIVGADHLYCRGARVTPPLAHKPFPLTSARARSESTCARW